MTIACCTATLSICQQAGASLPSGPHEAPLLQAEEKLPQPLLQGSATAPWYRGGPCSSLSTFFLYWVWTLVHKMVGQSIDSKLNAILQMGSDKCCMRGNPSSHRSSSFSHAQPRICCWISQSSCHPGSSNLPRSFWMKALTSSTSTAHPLPQVAVTCKLYKQGLVDFQVMHNIKQNRSYDRQMGHSTSYQPPGKL